MTEPEPVPEDLALRRKRVLYRAQHRGTQEMDILIGGYVAGNLDRLDSAALDRIEALMAHEETDLQAWLIGQRPVPETGDAELIDAIRAFRQQQVQAQQ